MATSAAYIDLTEGSAPATPAAGKVRIYAKADGSAYQKDDAGTETGLAGGGGGSALTNDKARVETDQSTSSTSFTDLTTTGPAVTLTVNTAVLVTVSCGIYAAVAYVGAMGFAVSGANTLAADRSRAAELGGASTLQGNPSRTIHLTGLTPGSTTFTAKYIAPGATTTQFRWREISVVCLD
jgi:hypothetical protein